MKWRAVAALVTLAVVGGLAVGLVAALWSGARTTSGFVTATTTSSAPGLYICEPAEQPAGAVPDNGCMDAHDDDGDTYVNDGCPAIGYRECHITDGGPAWYGICYASPAVCHDEIDQDGDGRVNDGCPVEGAAGELSLPTDLGQCPTDPPELDDSGHDEAIFEDTENLLPGEWVWDRVRLRNVGSAPLNILGAEIHVTETWDPGDDCCEADKCPIPYELWNEWEKAGNVKVWILGKWAWLEIIGVSEWIGGDPSNPQPAVPWWWTWWDAWVYSPAAITSLRTDTLQSLEEPSEIRSNDNRPFSDSYELETFAPTLMDGAYQEAGCGIELQQPYDDDAWLLLPECDQYSQGPYEDEESGMLLSWPVVDYNARSAVYIAEGDYEDMAISVRLPYDVPAGCEGNEWNIEVEWIAVETAPEQAP